MSDWTRPEPTPARPSPEVVRAGGLSAGELSPGELRWLAGVLTDAGEAPLAPLSSARITQGRSNLTHVLTDGASRWVLRTPPRAGRTPSAHDVAREQRVTAALVGTDVPVPAPVALVEGDDNPLGGSCAIAAFVAGETIQTRAQVEGLSPEQVTGICGELVRVLAALHSIDHVAVGLERLGRPDAYAERQLRRWAGQWAIVGRGDRDHDRVATQIAEALGRSIPAQPRTGIVHGDYRIDNTIVDLAEPSPLRAVVDWELSTVGDPVADVAMMCAYRDPVFDLVVGEPSAWGSDAMPGVGELAALYERASGATLEHWDFHLALARYKVAVIAAGIEHRRLSGGSGVRVATAGDAVPVLLEQALAGCRSLKGGAA